MREDTVLLYNPKLIRVDLSCRSSHDRRVKVDRHVYEYASYEPDITGTGTAVYRKAFEVRPNGVPVVPEAAMNEDVTKLQKQW